MVSKQAAVAQLDLKKLGSYLADKIAGFDGKFTVTKFNGGQSNPTFKLQTKAGDYVLRKQPAGKLLKSAHAVDREFRVLKALQNSTVPVPEVYHLCEDTEVLGSLFYVMQCVDGNVYWNSALPEVTDNTTRSAMYDAMNKALCNLHSVDVNQAELADYGNPGNYFERQFSRWSKQ